MFDQVNPTTLGAITVQVGREFTNNIFHQGKCLQLLGKKVLNCSVHQVFIKLHPDSSGQVSVHGTPIDSVV